MVKRKSNEKKIYYTIGGEPVSIEDPRFSHDVLDRPVLVLEYTVTEHRDFHTEDYRFELTDTPVVIKSKLRLEDANALKKTLEDKFINEHKGEIKCGEIPASEWHPHRTATLIKGFSRTTYHVNPAQTERLYPTLRKKSEDQTPSLDERLDLKEAGFFSHNYGLEELYYALISDATLIREVKMRPYWNFLGMIKVSPDTYKKVVDADGGLKIKIGELPRFTMEELAKHYATVLHQGQFRLGTNEPFIIHPQQVVANINEYGRKRFDPSRKAVIKDGAYPLAIETKNSFELPAIGWLHDTMENTEITYQQLKAAFGKEIADGVRILTRNVDREEYKQRLTRAGAGIQFIKLCDILHNTSTLNCLPKVTKKQYVEDCQSFYIPLAEKRGMQEIAVKIQNNLMEYFASKK